MTRREDIVGRGLFDVFPDNPGDSGATGTRNLHRSLERVVRERTTDVMAVQKYDVQRPDSEGGGFEERHWSPVNSPVLGPSGELLWIIHCVVDVTGLVTSESAAREDHDALRAMQREVVLRGRELQDANRELRTLHAELESRVAARTAELERANHDLRAEVAERERAQAALASSEAQLHQAQRLEAIGRLAGGVAHDFNNMLSVILGWTEELLESLSPEDPSRGPVQEIHRAGDRAVGLTRQLLAFSRQQVLAPEVVDVDALLLGLEEMIARLVGEDVVLRVHPGPGGPHCVLADRGRLEQVVMNLAVNSRDAMPRGGRLSLATECVELDEPDACERLGLRPGPHVMIAVSDTGMGMDQATRERAFEPFFTTKDRSKGTGLGLAMVFGIVKQSGGGIWLYSEVGAGTTIRIYLPQVQPSGAPEPAAAPIARTALEGRETVLLVEDEEQVRSVLVQMLSRAGHRVLAAGTPAEALAISEQHPERIELLLTDVVMPGMNGRQLADRIRDMRPDTRVLFMSGYTDDIVLHHGVVEPGLAFVEKPVTSRTLLGRIRDLLDST
jgi:two-component system cell cycle sensor histidine kinase/response regulator CckA